MSGEFFLALIIIFVFIVCCLALTLIFAKVSENVKPIGELFIDDTAFEGTIVQLNLYDNNFDIYDDGAVVAFKIVKNVDLTEP